MPSDSAMIVAMILFGLVLGARDCAKPGADTCEHYVFNSERNGSVPECFD